MQPGHGLICRRCIHRLSTLAEQGHVAPCALVGWRDTTHHAPAFDVHGRRCDGFLARLEPNDTGSVPGALGCTSRISQIQWSKRFTLL
jgi:hypothetical protein